MSEMKVENGCYYGNYLCLICDTECVAKGRKQNPNGCNEFTVGIMQSRSTPEQMGEGPRCAECGEKYRSDYCKGCGLEHKLLPCYPPSGLCQRNCTHPEGVLTKADELCLDIEDGDQVGTKSGPSSDAEGENDE